MKKTIALFVLLLLCVGLITPAFASNTQGITFSGSLDKSSITKSSEAQTVVLTLKASPAMTLDGFSCDVTCDDPLTFTAAQTANDSVSISSSDYFVSTKKICWSEPVGENVEGVTDFIKLTFTIPANTEAGTYNVGVSNLAISRDYADEEWENGATVSTTLTITDSTTASGYTAGVSTSNTDVTVGDTVAVKVDLTHTSDTTYTASELTLTYDSTKLTYSSVTGLDASKINSATAGTLKIADYGDAKTIGNAAYTVNFTAAASGTSNVTLSSAAFSNKADAATKDLVAATISPASVSVTSKNSYTVSLPSESYVSGNTSVTEGDDYTLTVTDYANYDYTVSATMGGAKASVTDNADGTYKVSSVSGNLVFTVTRTAKQYVVTFTSTTDVAAPSDAAAKATYGTDYRFTIPDVEHYTVNVTSIKYAGGGNVSYSSASGVVTIKGTNITDEFTVTLDKVQADATVTVEGTGASDAAGFTAYATPDTAYTLTVTKDNNYDYTVTAKVNSSDVTVTDNGNGTYTVAAVDVKAGTLVFTVNKSIKTEGMSVAEYVKIDGSTVWIVKYTVTTKLTGSVYTYKDNNMFWSDNYKAYCYLVIDGTKPTLAAADFAIVTGDPTGISGLDVNKTGKTDANDAQLVYNIYKAEYSAFTTDVTMEKFLLADTNHDSKVDTSDVVVIINSVLGK